MRLEKKKKVTDKSESHKAGRGKRHSMDGHNSRRKKEEGGRARERSSSVHAPLPTQRELLPGGNQTLSPCPALYSPGYCSQINLARYPV